MDKPGACERVVGPRRRAAGRVRDRSDARRRVQIVARSHPEAPFAGVYREIAPPGRLVFEAMGATGRVILREADGRTYMTVEIACRSDEELDQFLKMGVDAGTAWTLDNLVAYARRWASAA